MLDYVLIENQPYGTARGFQAAARAAGLGPTSLLGICQKRARQYGVAVCWNADDSVTTYTNHGGKVRQRTAEAGSDEARWLIERFRKAADRA